MWRQLLITGCIWLAVACSPVTITGHADQQADFNSYKTFGFAPNLINKLPRYPEYDNPQIRKLIRDAIANELTARGYTLDQRQPDLLVQYDILIIERIDPRVDSAMIYKPWVDTRIDSFNYTEGLLVVRLIDRQHSRLVWQGSLSGILNRKPRQFENRVVKYIGKLFETFQS